MTAVPNDRSLGLTRCTRTQRISSFNAGVSTQKESATLLPEPREEPGRGDRRPCVTWPTDAPRLRRGRPFHGLGLGGRRRRRDRCSRVLGAPGSLRSDGAAAAVHARRGRRRCDHVRAHRRRRDLPCVSGAADPRPSISARRRRAAAVGSAPASTTRGCSQSGWLDGASVCVGFHRRRRGRGRVTATRTPAHVQSAAGVSTTYADDADRPMAMHHRPAGGTGLEPACH